MVPSELKNAFQIAQKSHLGVTLQHGSLSVTFMMTKSGLIVDHAHFHGA